MIDQSNQMTRSTRQDDTSRPALSLVIDELTSELNRLKAINEMLQKEKDQLIVSQSFA